MAKVCAASEDISACEIEKSKLENVPITVVLPRAALHSAQTRSHSLAFARELTLSGPLVDSHCFALDTQ